MGWDSITKRFENMVYAPVGIVGTARIALATITVASAALLASSEASSFTLAEDVQAPSKRAISPDQLRSVNRMPPDFGLLSLGEPVVATHEDAGAVAGEDECTPDWHTFTAGGETGVAGTSQRVEAFTVWNGDLVVGGIFTTAGGQTVNGIARWDGSAWHPFTSGFQTGIGGVSFPVVRALTVWNGDLIAGGNFTTAGGQTVNRIARWDGTAWHPLTFGGLNGVIGEVSALMVWNGDLIVGGGFNTAAGITLNNIARWDGTQWHPFVAGDQIGLQNSVRALTIWNGDLVAGGNFSTGGGQTLNRIARWDGSTWHPFTSGGQIGLGGSSPIVHALTVWNGNLIAAGSYTTAGGQSVYRIARWDGAAWHPFTYLGDVGFITNVFASTVWNGDLIVGGQFTQFGATTTGVMLLNRIARWDGTHWHAFSSGGQVGVSGGAAIAHALKVWNDDLVVGGAFTTAGATTVNRIARWDGCLAGEPEPSCTGDITNSSGTGFDNVVNGFDLLAQLSCWGPVVSGCEAADLTDSGGVGPDGTVNGFDLLALLSNWGPCP